MFLLYEKGKVIGHIVTEDGVQADPEKVDKVRDWPTPKSSKMFGSSSALQGIIGNSFKIFPRLPAL